MLQRNHGNYDTRQRQLQYLIEKTTQCMCNIQNKNAHHAHIDMCTCTYIHMLRIHLTHTLNTCDTHTHTQHTRVLLCVISPHLYTAHARSLTHTHALHASTHKHSYHHHRSIQSSNKRKKPVRLARQHRC